MSRRTITTGDYSFGEARLLRDLRRDVMAAMAAEADLEGMHAARARLLSEFKGEHKGDRELCQQADLIARVVC